MFLYTYVFLLNLIYLSYLVPSNDIFIPRCRYTISSPDSSGCSDKQAEESTLLQDKTRCPVGCLLPEDNGCNIYLPDFCSKMEVRVQPEMTNSGLVKFRVLQANANC